MLEAVAYVRTRDRYENERWDERVNHVIKELGRALGAQTSG